MFSFFKKNKSKNKSKNDLANNEKLNIISDVLDSTNLSEGSAEDLIQNILLMKEKKVSDIMIIRGDIIAVSDSISYKELLGLMINQGYSRLPVYKDNLDDIICIVHIRDVIANGDSGDKFQIDKVGREPLFISPFMGLLELLFEMRTEKIHMALVVDEFGGIDGLVTIEDLLEQIVGNIEDEHDKPVATDYLYKTKDALFVNSKYRLDTMEESLGKFLTEEEREECETIGGLIYSLAGQVPRKGSLIVHKTSGLKFEILDASARKVNYVKIHNINSINK